MDHKYMHDNSAIMRETGLPYHFLKRCNAELPILEKYRQKKDKNKIYYSDNGLIVWREIRKLFEEQKTLAQIREQLENTFESRETTKETSVETNRNGIENTKAEHGRVGESQELVRLLFDAFERQSSKTEKVFEQALAQSQSEIKKTEELAGEYKKQLLALPTGKSPEQITQELDEKRVQEEELHRLRKEVSERGGKQRRLSELLTELEAAQGWRKKKRRAQILQEIKTIQF